MVPCCAACVPVYDVANGAAAKPKAVEGCGGVAVCGAVRGGGGDVWMGGRGGRLGERAAAGGGVCAAGDGGSALRSASGTSASVTWRSSCVVSGDVGGVKNIIHWGKQLKNHPQSFEILLQ